MDRSSAPLAHRLREHRLLLLILILATLLRLWQINESLWLDELHSAWVASAGMGEVAERAQIGNQSPLYFYLLRATTLLLGMSEWTLRLPSLVAGVGLVAAAYGLVYQFTHSRIAAIASSVLASFDRNFLFYANEARPYAWVQLVAVVQLYVFWRLQDASLPRRRLAFVVCSAALFYLHYTAILLVAGEVVFLLTRSLVCCRRDDAQKYRCRHLAIDLFGVMVMTVPMAPQLLDISSRRGAWGAFVNDTSLLLVVEWCSLVSYVVIPLIACLIFAFVGLALVILRQGSLTLDAILRLASDPSSYAAASDASPRGARSRFMAAYLLFCWLCVPVAIVWLLTVTDVARLYLGRYVIGAALAPVLFTGLCIGYWCNQRTRLLAAVSFVAYAILASGVIEQWRHDGRLYGDRAENWRAAVSYVNENQFAGPVFVRSGFLEADRLTSDNSELLRSYCVSPVTSIYRVQGPVGATQPLTTRDAGKLTSQDVKRVEASGSAWFIVNGTTATRRRCAQRVFDSLNRETYNVSYSEIQRGVVSDERQFGHVGVFEVLLFRIDDQVESLDHQPTSSNSMAAP